MVHPRKISEKLPKFFKNYLKIPYLSSDLLELQIPLQDSHGTPQFLQHKDDWQLKWMFHPCGIII